MRSRKGPSYINTVLSKTMGVIWQ